MGLFGFGKKKKEKVEKVEKVQNRDTGSFVGFVLLSEPIWDKAQFVKDFMLDWGIDISNFDREDKKYKDHLVVEQDDMLLTISFLDAPVPDGEAEHYAAANYMWPDAVEIISGHKAQILVLAVGEDDDLLEIGELFTKAVATCLKQRYAVGVYTDGAVFQPEFYREFSMVMKEDQIPIMNWIWFGIYCDEKQEGIYTYGMKKFGKDEMEVYVDKSGANLNEVREFLMSIVAYVLESDVILHDGETIGFSENQRLPITRSKGIALEGDTLKIGYKG